MKKIFNFILTASALLALAPAVFAQDYSINGQIKDKDGSTLVFPQNDLIINETAKVAYSKNISEPFSDGTYWIKLETFATGTAAMVTKYIPADIVLVLDISGSMDFPYGNQEPVMLSGTQNERTITYNQIVAGESEGIEYYYYMAGTGGNYYYKLYAERSGNNYVIGYNSGGNGTTHTVLASGTNANNVSYTNANSATEINKVYRGPSSRITTLKTAVKAFIDEIKANDQSLSGVDHNRVAIVTFGTNSSIVGNGWVDFGSDANVQTLKDNVSNIMPTGQTYPNLGMNNAQTLMNSSRSGEVSKTVVLFTDGIPYQGQWNTNATTLANQAIATANSLKGAGVTVWSVGVFDRDNDNTNAYMNRVSSNYSGATTMTNGTSVDTKYYFDATKTDLDLTGIFQSIASESGGSANTSLSAATSTVDVVSSSFILPDGVTAENVRDYVKIFTAKLNSIDASGNYVFDEEIMANYSTDTYNTYDEDGNVTGAFDVDNTISVALEGTNGIKVTGFDYSSNWCGPIYNVDGTTVRDYQGHKVIIMIPIKMNPEAVGGPGVSTNAEGSGIYINADDKEALLEFESPKVSLPVNLHIKKQGLEEGESAKFTIMRSINADSSSPTWEYVTSIFVTRHAGQSDDPVTKVVGVPSVDNDSNPYVYKIVEDDWDWSYVLKSITDADGKAIGNVGDRSVRSDELISNPFIFVNARKSNIDIKVRHAESKATNTFKTGGGVSYDDSKANTRTNSGGSN